MRPCSSGLPPSSPAWARTGGSTRRELGTARAGVNAFLVTSGSQRRPRRFDRCRALLNAAQTADARPALDVELLLVLDREPEVVLGLAADHEDAREARLPAVEIAHHPETLGQELAL